MRHFLILYWDRVLAAVQFWGLAVQSPGNLNDNIMIRNENVNFQGFSATAGLKGRIGHVCKEDAEVVKCMRASGAIIIGLTNTRLVILRSQDSLHNAYLCLKLTWCEILRNLS